ncbi:MAG: hypothetical protein ABII90_10570 [Bacteroidota bacterium]
MQHRQEDSHAVYVGGNRDDNNAIHRQEHRNAVYVVNVKDTKKCGVNNELGHELGHSVQVKDVMENEDRTTKRK